MSCKNYLGVTKDNKIRRGVCDLKKKKSEEKREEAVGRLHES